MTVQIIVDGRVLVGKSDLSEDALKKHRGFIFDGITVPPTDRAITYIDKGRKIRLVPGLNVIAAGSGGGKSTRMASLAATLLANESYGESKVKQVLFDEPVAGNFFTIDTMIEAISASENGVLFIDSITSVLNMQGLGETGPAGIKNGYRPLLAAINSFAAAKQCIVVASLNMMNAEKELFQITSGATMSCQWLKGGVLFQADMKHAIRPAWWPASWEGAIDKRDGGVWLPASNLVDLGPVDWDNPIIARDYDAAVDEREMAIEEAIPVEQSITETQFASEQRPDMFNSLSL